MSQPTPSASTYSIRVVGAPRASLRDLYHSFLRAPWSVAIAALAAFFLLVNAAFAVAYALVGGVANMPPGSLAQAFYFSVQSMGTIGYGAMYPQSHAANLLVVLQALLGLLYTALATGLVFAKFAQPVGRLAFARSAVIAPWEGTPTLMFRLGNERGNYVVEATVHVDMVRTLTTTEGVRFYRQSDLALVRSRTAALTRSWNVMHVITPESPLYGLTPEDLAAQEVELLVSVMGTDETSAQPVHGRHTYEHSSIVWGARYADVLHEMPDGNMVLDVRRFHDTVPSQPTEAFPYPRG